MGLTSTPAFVLATLSIACQKQMGPVSSRIKVRHAANHLTDKQSSLRYVAMGYKG